MSHKETALALADEVSERAKAIGSSNTLIFESGKIIADDNTVVADIVARPMLNSFLDAAQARNLKTVSGLGMLLHQAPPGFEAWYGVKPTVDDAVRDVMLAD